MLCKHPRTKTGLFWTYCFVWKKEAVIFKIRDLYVACLCWIKLRQQQHLSGGWSAPLMHLAMWVEIRLMTLTSTVCLPVFSSPFLLPSVPSSKSRTTVKVITMKNLSASIYGASQSSSAKTRTGNIMSLWNVLFTRNCNVARHFIFATSLHCVHLLIWI